VEPSQTLAVVWHAVVTDGNISGQISKDYCRHGRYCAHVIRNLYHRLRKPCGNAVVVRTSQDRTPERERERGRGHGSIELTKCIA
jgi:hypothetical protein